jgi:hypothetical protein
LEVIAAHYVSLEEKNKLKPEFGATAAQARGTQCNSTAVFSKEAGHEHSSLSTRGIIVIQQQCLYNAGCRG